MGHTSGTVNASEPTPVHPHLRGAYHPRVGHTGPGREPARPAAVHPHIRGAYVGVAEQQKPTPTVHPHIRGAYGISRPANTIPIGSSPHTWGIPIERVRYYERLRFIPTYVGYTARRRRSAWGLPVHPHIRGVYVDVQVLIVDGGRFIPTYVGYTTCGSQCALLDSVHPHIRGVYGTDAALLSFRLRFIPTYVGHTDEVLKLTETARFIPTYVGHTLSISPSSRISMVHPHLRGAYGWYLFIQIPSTRFIPTYVGHT